MQSKAFVWSNFLDIKETEEETRSSIWIAVITQYAFWFLQGIDKTTSEEQKICQTNQPSSQYPYSFW